MNRTTDVMTPEALEEQGSPTTQPSKRPSYWGVDADPSRRPGVPMERTPPAPFPNTVFPPERQVGESSAPLHGRPHKTMPPVFSTAVPLHGLSGIVRRYAYSLPDHRPSHWLLKLLGDRVESMTYRAKKYLPWALPVLGVALLLGRTRETDGRLRGA